MTEHFTIGDILLGTVRGRDEAFHPILYLGEFDHINFLGGMITHSPKYGNKLLSEMHFDIVPPSKKPGPTYFVRKKLLKKSEWGPFTKVGQLSREGIDYVNGTIDKFKPRLWPQKSKSNK